jgi:hypothetical protein
MHAPALNGLCAPVVSSRNSALQTKMRLRVQAPLFPAFIYSYYLTLDARGSLFSFRPNEETAFSPVTLPLTSIPLLRYSVQVRVNNRFETVTRKWDRPVDFESFGVLSRVKTV